MKKIIIILSILLIQPFINSFLYSSILKFGSQIRFRYEFQNNFNQKFYGNHPKLGKANDGFLLGRFNLGFDYFYKNIHLKLWGQDSEAWDIAIPDKAFFNKTFNMENNPNKDRLELWESYFEINKIFHKNLKLKAGRQRIYYGDKRVFGPGSWGNSGRWIWDAIKISYKFKIGFIDMYYGKTMLHDPEKFSLNHRHGFKSIGMYSHFTLPKNFLKINIEPFFMTKTDNHNRYKSEDGKFGDLKSYYIGTRIYKNKLKNFDFDFLYIVQRGDLADDNIRAYGYHALIGYNLKNICLNPKISVEYSYGSGDKNPHDGKHETFDGAFGARDKMYGRMNLFHWKNIKDAQMNLELKPVKKVYIKMEMHKFWLAQKKDAWYLNKKYYRDITGKSGDYVGKEFDIVMKTDLPKNNVIQLGYGHFIPGQFAKNVASNKEANWFFMQWQYKFSWKIF